MLVSPTKALDNSLEQRQAVKAQLHLLCCRLLPPLWVRTQQGAAGLTKIPLEKWPCREDLAIFSQLLSVF